MKIEVLNHASIRLIGEKTIYFDPYQIDEDFNDADYIFITHDHYDHYDYKSILKVSKDSTRIIVPKCLKDEKCDLVVEANQSYVIDDISFDVIPSYNLNKKFHPKDKEYVGYNILLEDRYYYIMGDTDRTPEADLVKTNVCFVPIGGVYTMDVWEAISFINDLKPDLAIPIHYGSVVGETTLGAVFKENIDTSILVDVQI